MPPVGPNDLFASQNDTNKWAYIMQYLKKDPKNTALVNTVNERNEKKFNKIEGERK